MSKESPLEGWFDRTIDSQPELLKGFGAVMLGTLQDGRTVIGKSNSKPVEIQGVEGLEGTLVDGQVGFTGDLIAPVEAEAYLFTHNGPVLRVVVEGVSTPSISVSSAEQQRDVIHMLETGLTRAKTF